MVRAIRSPYDEEQSAVVDAAVRVASNGMLVNHYSYMTQGLITIRAETDLLYIVMMWQNGHKTCYITRDVSSSTNGALYSKAINGLHRVNELNSTTPCPTFIEPAYFWRTVTV